MPCTAKIKSELIVFRRRGKACAKLLAQRPWSPKPEICLWGGVLEARGKCYLRAGCNAIFAFMFSVPWKFIEWVTYRFNMYQSDANGLLSYFKHGWIKHHPIASSFVWSMAAGSFASLVRGTWFRQQLTSGLYHFHSWKTCQLPELKRVKGSNDFWSSLKISQNLLLLTNLLKRFFRTTWGSSWFSRLKISCCDRFGLPVRLALGQFTRTPRLLVSRANFRTFEEHSEDFGNEDRKEIMDRYLVTLKLQIMQGEYLLMPSIIHSTPILQELDYQMYFPLIVCSQNGFGMDSAVQLLRFYRSHLLPIGFMYWLMFWMFLVRPLVPRLAWLLYTKANMNRFLSCIRSTFVCRVRFFITCSKLDLR